VSIDGTAIPLPGRIRSCSALPVTNTIFKEWKEMRNLDVLKYALSQELPGQTVGYKEKEWVNVKLHFTSLDRRLGVQTFQTPTISRQSAHNRISLLPLFTGRFYPKELRLILISVILIGPQRHGATERIQGNETFKDTIGN
jgi:hypothetical protein